MTTTTYEGPIIDDCELLAELPNVLAQILTERNGWIDAGGGLHVRGVCSWPLWHSLGYAWKGEGALHRMFREVQVDDIPVAEDCLGDQFLLRDERVMRLHGETGEVENLELGWSDFLDKVRANAVEFLSLQPLQAFVMEGGRLEPGQLLSAYPPYVTAESRSGQVSLRALPAMERIGLLADLARQIQGVKDGERVRIVVK